MGPNRYMRDVDGSLLFAAECYASGATPYYPMSAWADEQGPDVTPTPELYRALHTYARFARQHRELLTHGYRAETKLALIYSVASFLPKYCGALRLLGTNPYAKIQNDHFLGFARYLERNHLPYNVEVLGEEEFWPDGNLAERLSRYRVLVCPNVEAMSDAQMAVFRSYLRAGRSCHRVGRLGNARRTVQFAFGAGPG